jgi:hypothetical protein
MKIVDRSHLWILLVALFVAACAGGIGGAPAPTAVGGGLVTTEDEAIARVLGTEPRFAGITKRDPDMIGQSSWYDAVPASGVGAFIVTVRIGWGDCQAGCIDEHTWVYAVAPDGVVTLQSEGGGPVPDDAWPSPGAGGQGDRTGILIAAVAGPVCPVETVPPDPACAPKPVANATIDIIAADGAQDRHVLDAAGQGFVELKPGVYRVVAQPGAGSMHAPEVQRVSIEHGRVTEVTFTFDTGIR